MRLSLLSLPLAGLLLSAASVRAEASSPHPLKKVLVWVVTKDPQLERELELKILEVFAERRVGGSRYSDLFPHGLPASLQEAVDQMRGTGCDSLLVLRRRASIHWSNSRSKGASSLIGFLKIRSQILNPNNQVDSEVSVPVEPAAGPAAVPGPFDDSAQATLEIIKGRVSVFNLTTEKLLWEANSQVKRSTALPTSLYYKRIATTVADALAKAGFIPAGNKSPLSEIVP